MVYRQTLTPDKENHSIEMPKEFFGRKVEVIVMDVADPISGESPAPPAGKKVSVNDLLKDFGAAPDFPSVETIRTKSWPSKW